ncbi:MAG: M81 family metallopeptidase [Planctomycetaceae bacterium]|nr:M81 family metallopeptidase [Planctomycetaceae bacterium]
MTRPLRIAVGQIWQETNTFNRNASTLADFENWGVAAGSDMLSEYGATGELGGFVSAVNDWPDSVELTGLVRFVCWPWGPVDHDTWQTMQRMLREQLQTAQAEGPLDAVFLALHGAMAAEGEPDLTGAALELVREIVGPDVPILGTLDLHANITRRMLASADVLTGYHACPHLDSAETGQRSAAALRKMLTDNIRPATIHCKLPMITPAELHNTFTGPPAPLYRRLEQLEQQPEVLSAGLYMTMPWVDSPEVGWSVLLTATAATPALRQSVDELAEQCWNLRETMSSVERLTPAAVVDRALEIDGFPVVIGDGADATNSGSPGDQTHLLAEFLARPEIPHGALTFLVDPAAVQVAWQAGVNSPFEARVGAGFAPEYSSPVLFQGTVERLLEVNFVLDGHIGSNLPIRMGRGAVIRSGDVTVLLTEKSGPGSTPRLYEAAGLDPKTCGIVVAKSPAGFRAEYESFAAACLLSDCPGCAPPNLSRLTYQHVNRPLWPLDEITQPGEAPWCR